MMIPRTRMKNPKCVVERGTDISYKANRMSAKNTIRIMAKILDIFSSLIFQNSLFCRLRIRNFEEF